MPSYGLDIGRDYRGMTMAIRDKRKAAGITQSQAALKLGLSLRQYQRIEASGKAKPAIEKLAALVMEGDA